ncbi:MAG: FAD-dependent oxidoreductase [Lachnospiraceae bacterium]|nr:FAD-dependent oxidoreductase [Lachnospiraceae bacterium]
MIRISQIKIDAEIKDQTKALDLKVKKKLKTERLPDYSIVKKSLDARYKPKLYYVYTVDVDVSEGMLKASVYKDKQISQSEITRYVWPEGAIRKDAGQSVNRPVIVGMGPAGLFCAYMLAHAGCKPLIFERGKPVEDRVRDVETFFNDGILNPESNIQFGEGGAGTFSDGKLNTLVNDRFGRSGKVLEIFVKHGAPKHILYDSKPHIGTDVLRTVVADMRNEIISCGGEIRYEHKLTGVKVHDGYVSALVNDDLTVDTSALVLAIGHSARDTYHMLYDMGVSMEVKPFAVGMRVLHSQSIIDSAQYGSACRPSYLPAAAYKLAHRTDDGRNVYSFCMCPGGYVVNASSYNDHTAVNGMSYSGRSGKYANSGIIMGVDTADFGADDVFAGLRFQERLERSAYELGRGLIPIQSLDAYRKGITDSIHLDRRGLKGGAVEANLNGLLGDTLRDTFLDGMNRFDKIIPGFGSGDTILAGVESRTSSPLRITRDKSYEASVPCVYPCGEGAGYAGGIMSAAMDGMIIAEEIWKKRMIQ